MKVVSVINYKGGVGKTTITNNLASDLAHRGKRVLAIDLDPQANLTFSYIPVKEWADHYASQTTLKYWFDSILQDISPRPSFKQLIIKKEKVDLICSHLGLINIDSELSTGLVGATMEQCKTNFIKIHSYIKNELEQFREDYDIVLIDCPPNFNIVTKNALVASDYYIVPSNMTFLANLGINHLNNHVNKLVDEFNAYTDKPSEKIEPTFLGVVATMVSLWGNEVIAAQQQHMSELERNNISIFNTKIRDNKRLMAAINFGKPIVLQKTRSKNPVPIIEEFKALTTEFMQKIDL